MSDLDELLAYWRAADRLFQNVEETWWGAVVSDRRYPRIHEANYALVQTAEPVHLGEIDDVLGPAARAAGAPFDHVVVLAVEEQTELIAEASTRGELLSFDQVMRWSDRPPDVDPRVAAIDDPDEAFWTAFRDSARVFGVEDEAVSDELGALEREVMLPAGRTWFAVRDGTEIVTLGGLLVLEGVGFVDGVVTLERARGHGNATALITRVLAEATRRGARATYLLTEPDGPAVGIYRRAGFGTVTRIGGWVTDRGVTPTTPPR